MGTNEISAEQMDDVRTLFMTGSANNPEFHRAKARLRPVLYPATEPAEEVAVRCTESIGLRGTVATCELSDGHRGRHFASTEPPLPAPTVPAEEETKAEVTQTVYDEAVSLSYWLAKQLGEHVDDASDRGETLTDTVQRLIDHIRPVLRKTTSSPVVPAPTETGPWAAAADVPEGIVYRSHNRTVHHTWINRDGAVLSVRNQCEDGHFSDGVHCRADLVDAHFAPFVAAEEKDA